MPQGPKLCVLAFIVLLGVSCSEELNVVPDNEPFSSFNISDIKIENYVNRLFIDLIGREPLDNELDVEVERLKKNDLSRESRDSIIYMLMTDTTFRPDEFSYKAAYVQNLYNLAKARCVESVPDSEFTRLIGIAKFGALADSLENRWDEFYKKKNEIRRYQAALTSREALLNGWINYHQVFAFMVDNGIYDAINMNTFNFVRATFDELLWRLPTVGEYDRAFNMVEKNLTETLFGSLGSNKNDYVRILNESLGMLEGMIIWEYQVMLNRPPTSEELVTLLPEYTDTKNINNVIAKILVTDEYANFR